METETGHELPKDADRSTGDRNPDIIGAPVDRTDGRLKVTGGARYSAEINLPGLVYGVLITSTIADGTVASMDTSEAEKAPGVMRVFTPFNTPKRCPKQSSMGVGAVPYARKLALLQDDAVHYFLQPIGVVVADTLVHATHAAELVKVKYAEGKVTMGLVEHLDDAFAPDGISGSVKKPADTAEGAASAALNSAPKKVEYIYQTPTENAQPDGTARDHRVVGRGQPDVVRFHAGRVQHPLADGRDCSACTTTRCA